MAATGIKTAFIIMPFSTTTDRHTDVYWTRFFSDFLKPQLERRKYVCTRSQARPESIVKGILKDLRDSDLVVAVLTDFNANVWYELGIRHALRSGTIMMIEQGQKLPFDIASYGVLVYEDTLAAGPAFEQALDEFIGKIERDRPVDSPAQEFLDPTSRDQLESIRRNAENLSQLKMKDLLRSSEIRFAIQNGTTGTPTTPKILWVDDYPSNNDVLIETYRSRGVHFDLALSTDQAMEFLGENPETYALIISDMGRGIQSDAGVEFLTILKQRWKSKLPVVIYCSSRAAKAYGDKAKDLGALDVTTSAKELSFWIDEVVASQKTEWNAIVG